MGNKTQRWKRLTLVVVEKNKSKDEYKLDRPTIGIGRSDLNQIVLHNRGVSPFHARITVEGRKCVITDLGSHQGLKVNGERIDTEVLYPGDEIQIGRVHLKVASDVPEKRVVVRKEETPRRKEQTPRKKKVKLHIPVRLIIILVIIFVVILILDIHLLVQLINWQ